MERKIRREYLAKIHAPAFYEAVFFGYMPSLRVFTFHIWRSSFQSAIFFYIKNIVKMNVRIREVSNSSDHLLNISKQ